MPAPVALVDCNNFYASCEKLFQPALRDRAVVVLSNNDGCVIARSNEAKAMGVGMGEAWHKCRGRPDVRRIAVRSSNYPLYGDMSARVMKVLSGFTRDIEVYSIDEAFLSMAGFEGDMEAHARDMRATVLAWTGIPVSVGIAPTKTLAKLANRLSKKDPANDGVCMLMTPEAQEAALASVAITDVWGIGSGYAERLAQEGIATPMDLRRADPRALRETFGVVMERTVRELGGTPCMTLNEAPSDRKSVVSSRSFGKLVTDKRELEQAIATFVSKGAEKLRKQSLTAGRVVVFFRTNHFRTNDPQYAAEQAVSLSAATADTLRLTSVAVRAMEAVYRPGFGYKKAGVMLLDLGPASRVQESLFEKSDDAASVTRMKLLDEVNAKFGRGTLVTASAGLNHGWHGVSRHLSRRFTTHWDELLSV